MNGLAGVDGMKICIQVRVAGLPTLLLEVFTNTQYWHYYHYCQLCIPIYLLITSLCESYDASIYENRCQ